MLLPLVKARNFRGGMVVQKLRNYWTLISLFPGPESMEVAAPDSVNDPPFGQFYLQDNFRLGSYRR